MSLPTYGVAFAVPLAFGLAIFSACGSVPPISRIEDKARLDVPIAICRKALAPGDVGDAGVARTDAYWSLVFPTFGGFGTALRADEVDCTGERAFTGPAATRVSAPAIGPDDLVVSGSEEGLSVAWLRAFHESDSVAEGPVALVRTRPSELDLYAVGRFRGSPLHSRFELATLGTLQLIVAHDEGCADVKVDAECDSNLFFFVAAGGKLIAAADSPGQRIRYGNLKGLGRVQYRITTDPPLFDDHSIRVHEKLQVRDASQEDVRRAEGDRVFVVAADGRLVADQGSLWSQVNISPDK